jgi:putative tricarboxylic transport membrane protein
MTKQERIAGIFLLLLGLAVIFYSLTQLSVGTIHHPGPGFFPVISGAGILILGAIWILKNLKKNISSKPLWAKGDLKGPVFAVIVIAVYAFLLEVLGYVLSTAVFLGAWEFFISKEKFLRAALIIVIVTAAMYFVFHYLLGVSLPEGTLINLTLGGK